MACMACKGTPDTKASKIPSKQGAWHPPWEFRVRLEGGLGLDGSVLRKEEGGKASKGFGLPPPFFTFLGPKRATCMVFSRVFNLDPGTLAHIWPLLSQGSMQ